MRRAFFVNLVLAFCWSAVTGRLSALNLLIGFGIGFCIMLAVRPLWGPPQYGRRLWLLIELVLIVLLDLVQSSLRVAARSLNLKYEMRSGVIAVDLDLGTDHEIAILAGLITMMPGTLTLDITDDRNTMFVHVMHIPEEDVEEYAAEIKEKLEARVRRIVGHQPGD